MSASPEGDFAQFIPPLAEQARRGWRDQLEIDDEGGWWLTHDGRRRNKKPWRPADELDAFIAHDVLYMLNDHRGSPPFPRAMREEASREGISLDQLRWRIRKAAMGLWLRDLLR